ncbi:hypothetical protein N431DRAFT_226019 [Stipitochalara longipes BDJ]|nr:hypothetical protein N431DRAFT_226019 [Stipitochalara longipes BDJ]
MLLASARVHGPALLYPAFIFSAWHPASCIPITPFTSHSSREHGQGVPVALYCSISAVLASLKTLQSVLFGLPRHRRIISWRRPSIS